jgi:uncharacterized coiled-coil protein SlyX
MSICLKHRTLPPDILDCVECLKAKLTAAEDLIGRLNSALATTSEHNARLNAKVKELTHLLTPVGQGESYRIIDQILDENKRYDQVVDALTAVQLSHAKLEQSLELEQRGKAVLQALYDQAVQALKETKARSTLKGKIK